MALKLYKPDVNALTRQFQTGGGGSPSTSYLTTDPRDTAARAAARMKGQGSIKGATRAALRSRQTSTTGGRKKKRAANRASRSIVAKNWAV